MSELFSIGEAKFILEGEFHVTDGAFRKVLRSVVKDYDSLLADREALVRWARHEVWWDGETDGTAWKALSQELRDAISGDK